MNSQSTVRTFLAGVSLETGNQDALLPCLTRLVIGLPKPQRKQLLKEVSSGDLTGIRAKRPRLRLNPEAYHQLWSEVLERDGWRCQSCGRMEDIEVHQIQWRSWLGHAAVENLIALCASCRQKAHRELGRL